MMQVIRVCDDDLGGLYLTLHVFGCSQQVAICACIHTHTHAHTSSLWSRVAV